MKALQMEKSIKYYQMAAGGRVIANSIRNERPSGLLIWRDGDESS